MSLFATLKRIKGRKGPADNELKPSSNPVFSSTPNLYKIDKEKPISPLVQQHFERRPSSSASINWGSRLSPKRKTSISSTNNNNNGRTFTSMVSMVNSLKRVASKKFGSSTHLNSREGEHERKEGSMKLKLSSKSEERLWRGEHKPKNNEPGVISSNSSSCASDIGSIGEGRGGSFRSSAEKSDIREEGEDSSDNEVERTPEEMTRTNLMLQGVKKFNMDHKKGIEFLIQNEFIQNTSEDVAQFLKDGEALSKTAIGNYLGERIDFNEDVLKAFVDLHDFTDVLLVQALRQFLWSFRLPGESQKIDRMMEAFAKRYCQLNPGIFSNTDTCYLLSFAIIMLNTTLHNPNVKNKPTVEQFIKMNRDIDGGRALNTNFIISLYHSIQAEPFQIPPEDGNDLMLTFFNPDIEGWLYKQGGRYKNWKRLWFILSNNCLYFFKFTTDKTPRGIIPLENIIVKLPTERSARQPYAFILSKESADRNIPDFIKTCKTMSDGTTVPARYACINLAASCLKERDKWVKSINKNNSLSRFYSDLTLKKRSKEAMEKHPNISKNNEKRPVVRKSQISLPSTVPGVIVLPVPDEVMADPRKNPHNFFEDKNIKPVCRTNESLSNSESFGHENIYDPEISPIQSRTESRQEDVYEEDDLSRSNPKHTSMNFEDNLDNVLELHRSLNTSAFDEGLFSPNNVKSSKLISSHDTFPLELCRKLSIIAESDRNSVFVDKLPMTNENVQNFQCITTSLNNNFSVTEDDSSRSNSLLEEKVKIENEIPSIHSNFPEKQISSVKCDSSKPEDSAEQKLINAEHNRIFLQQVDQSIQNISTDNDEASESRMVNTETVKIIECIRKSKDITNGEVMTEFDSAVTSLPQLSFPDKTTESFLLIAETSSATDKQRKNSDKNFVNHSDFCSSFSPSISFTSYSNNVPTSCPETDHEVTLLPEFETSVCKAEKSNLVSFHRVFGPDRKKQPHSKERLNLPEDQQSITDAINKAIVNSSFESDV